MRRDCWILAVEPQHMTVTPVRCGELEKHLSQFKCETIPNDAIKRMLLDCITGKAQSEIVLLKPDGLAFDNYEIGEFFQELLKKFILRMMGKAERWNTCRGDRRETKMLGSITQTS